MAPRTSSDRHRRIRKPREKNHQCYVCSKVFYSKADLRRHLLVHTGEKPLKCDICDKAFRREGHLQGHKLTHTGERPHQCEICKRRFTARQALTRHMLVHTGEKPYVCETCNKAYATKPQLRWHMAVHGGKTHRCRVCKRSFYRYVELRNHQATHFSEKKHACKVCGKTFHFTNNLRMHMSNVHKDREKVFCGVCGKELRTNFSLKMHLKAHLEKLPCKCETCKNEFREKHNYKEPKPTAEYVCELCFKRFRYRATLESHFLLHTREKAHKCDKCGECFSVPQSLRYHVLKKHSEEPNAVKYPCNECGKLFVSEKYLLIHTANHSKETLPPCHLCKKAFSVLKLEGQSDLLTDHVPNCEMRNKALQQLSNIQSTPQGEGNAYACDACNKIFSKETFVRHLRSHTGEKPYKCDVCSLGFASFSNLKGHSMKKHDKELEVSKRIPLARPFSDLSELKQHLSTHTKEQNQSCEVCDKAFNRKERYESYLQSGEAPPSPAPSYDSSGHFPDDPPDNWSEPVQQPLFITQDIEISNLYTVSKAESSKERFQCHQCEKSYSNKHNLKLHSMTHAGKWPHACQFCGKGFLLRRTMRLHMLTHTRDYPYKCDLCDKQYPLKVYLQQHMLSHTGEKPYVCHFCDTRFSGKYHVQRHIRAHHFDKIQNPKTSFSCKLCGKTFGLLPVLKRHLWTHANEVPFKCDICNKPFSHQQSLKVHMKSHLSGKFSQKCEFCWQVFSQEKYLRRHIKRHHPAKTFPCSQCDKVLASSYALKNHLLFHSGVRPYQCEVCYKTFVKKPNFEKHSLVHQRICKWCNKEFPTVHQLMKHRKSHSEEALHDCHLCDKKFVLISKLRLHLVVAHGAEKPFQCELCPESFNSKALLTQHMLMHKLLSDGQELHGCKLCSKVFSKKMFLDKHVSSKHPSVEQDPAAKNPYQCESCPERFATKALLGKHMVMHKVLNAGRKPNDCKFCSKVFSSITYLENHMSSSHPNEEPFPEEVSTGNLNIAGVKESNPKKVADTSSITILVPINIHQKPNYCKFCSKVFSSRIYLENHMSSFHPNEEPFPEEVSTGNSNIAGVKESNPKKVADPSSITNLVPSNIRRKPHNCKFCRKKFKRRIYLEKHMSSFHPNEELFPEEVSTGNSNIAGVKESNPKKVADPSSITILVPSNIIAGLKKLPSSSQLNDTTGSTVAAPSTGSSPEKPPPTILLLTVPPPNPINTEQLVEKQGHSGFLKERKENVGSDGLLLNESNFQKATDVLPFTNNIEAKHSSEKLLTKSNPRKASKILLFSVQPPNPVKPKESDSSSGSKDSSSSSQLEKPISRLMNPATTSFSYRNNPKAGNISSVLSEKLLTESNPQKAPKVFLLSVQPPNPVKPKESDSCGGGKDSSSSSQLKKPISRRVNSAKTPLRHRNNPKAGNISSASIPPSSDVKPEGLGVRQGCFDNSKRPYYNYKRMMFENRVSRLKTPVRHQIANFSSVIIQPPSHVLAEHLSRLSSVHKGSPHSLKTTDKKVGPVRPLYQQSNPQNAATISPVRIQPISPVKPQQSSGVPSNSDCQKEQSPIDAQGRGNSSISCDKAVLKENSPQKPATISSIKPCRAIARLRILQ